MPYIKLLTVLAGLALLTACGGGTAETPDTAGGNATDCKTNAFHADCNADAPAIELRQSMCLADDSADSTCGVVITGACEANPFRTETACGHTDYDDDRETACQTHGTGMGGDDSCATSLISVCLLADPFIYPGCDDVAGIDDGVRTMYCEDSATAWDEECMDGIHGTVVSFRTIACLESSFNDPANPLCLTDSFTEAACGMNPFDSANPGCRNLMKFSEIVGTYCMTNDAADCPNVTTADWVDSFNTLATAPVSTDTANQFLSGLTDTPPVIEGFDAGSVSDFGSSLTLAYNGLGGDATDGASFFWGNFDISEGVFNTRYYAGIHASTDLGAPLNNVSQAGIWTGWILLNGSFSINRRFDLNVTFGTTSNGNAGTIDAFTTTGGSFRLKIDGEFNDKGVIEGTTLSGTTSDEVTIVDNQWRTPGTLTGLIGQQGVVAAFVSTTNTNNNDDTLGRSPYSGAFVARPRTPDPEPLVVNYGDWVRDSLPSLSATPDVATEAPTHKNQFLEGTATTLTPLIQSTTPTTLFMTGSTDNGVGFFTENSQYYAGLLSNTSLGAPVAITPQVSDADVTATWPGKIRAIGVFDGNSVSGDTTTALDLELMVNLTARTFTGTAVDPNADTTSIIINGNFPAKDRGVVTGTVTEATGASNKFGQLTGLIGQDGVVGAFYSNSNVEVSRRYVGGFYAAPQ